MFSFGFYPASVRFSILSVCSYILVCSSPTCPTYAPELMLVTLSPMLYSDGPSSPLLNCLSTVRHVSVPRKALGMRIGSFTKRVQICELRVSVLKVKDDHFSMYEYMFSLH